MAAARVIHYMIGEKVGTIQLNTNQERWAYSNDRKGTILGLMAKEMDSPSFDLSTVQTVKIGDEFVSSPELQQRINSAGYFTSSKDSDQLMLGPRPSSEAEIVRLQKVYSSFFKSTPPQPRQSVQNLFEDNQPRYKFRSSTPEPSAPEEP